MKKILRARHLRGTSTHAKAISPVMLGKATDYWRKGIVEHLPKIRGIYESRFDDMGLVLSWTVPYLTFPKFDFDITTQEFNDYLVKEAKVRLSPGTSYGTTGEEHQRFTIVYSV